MFDADRPITKSDQDRLNRTVFAKYLARSMLDHTDPESFVIGLYGGWGVGKTSLINLMVEELTIAANNAADEEKPIILNFSAWSYSGQDQLVYNFFRRLSSALRSVTYLKHSDRIIHLLELYVSFFTQKPVPKSLRPKQNWYQKLSLTQDDYYAWESGRDLTSIKSELNELLKSQKHKIIIMIDNISRLYPEEIKQMFQIIKSMGDYSNTIYLLALDKDHVVHAINEVDDGSGEEFVDKVVQLPFDVPPIQPQDLENILADRLNDIVKTVPEGTWEKEYWADIYHSSLKFLFNHCRDITRYTNTLNFGYTRSRDIVNPVDYFALTAIEVFAPDVYAGIRNNKDMFSDLLDNVYSLNDIQIENEKARCNEIIARCGNIPRTVILELLLRLFPRLQKIYRPEVPYYYSDAMARKLRRVSSPDLFDVYFRLSLQAGQLNESEFESIMQLAYDKESFDQALMRLNQDDRVLKFIDKLDGTSLTTLQRDIIKNVISALIDNGDLFPAGMNSALSLDTAMRIHRIIHQLLHRFKNKDERFDIMQDAIASATKSIYITVHELREQQREHDAENDAYLPDEYRDFTSVQLESLQKLTVSRIEYWAKHGSLAEHPQLLPILFAWHDWGNEETCRSYIDALTQTDKGLVAFLTSVFADPINQAMSSHVKKSEWESSLREMEKLIAPMKLENLAKTIFEGDDFEKLNERQQLAIMIFLDLLKTKTNKVIPNTTAE